MRRVLVAICLLLSCSARGAQSVASADVVYVTDELRLGLYSGEDTAGRALKTLVSGSRLDVLERSLMSIRVRTEEGDEGWVKTAYVVTVEPARRRLAAVTALQEETAAALAAREADVRRLSEESRSLEAALAEAEQGIQDLPAVRAENENLMAALSARGISVPLPWLFGITGITLLAGFGLGYWWLDRRVRRQFGGHRLY